MSPSVRFYREMLVIVLCFLLPYDSYSQQSTNGKTTTRRWSPWTGWSSCSRSCGQGVQYRKRICHTRYSQSTPTRTDSKTLCQGPEKQYKVCKNTCAGTNSDYRSVECEKHNGKYFGGRRYEWQAYINPYNRCELSCKAKNYRYYARFGDSVENGTSCKPDKEAVCIGGLCLDVGCDGIAGSGSQVDQCGVCGGDSKSCRIISGIFTRTHLKHFGYNTITKIPAGACNINITELARSRNYLALKVEGGSYFLNGHRRLHPTGRYHGAGTEFEYHRREHNRCPGECIQAKGPTNTTIVVELLYYHRNPGIMYHFTIPKNLMGSVMTGMMSKFDGSDAVNTGNHQKARRQQKNHQNPHHRENEGLQTGRETSNQNPSRPSINPQNDIHVTRTPSNGRVITAPRWVDRGVQSIKYGQTPQYIPSRTQKQPLQLAGKTSIPPSYRHGDSGFRNSRQSVRGLYGNRYQSAQGGQKTGNVNASSKRKAQKAVKKEPDGKRRRVHPRQQSRRRSHTYNRRPSTSSDKRLPGRRTQQTSLVRTPQLGSSRVLGAAHGTRRQYYHPNQYQTGYVDRQHTYGTHPDANRLVHSNFQHAPTLSTKPYRYDNTIAQTPGSLRSGVYSPPDGTYTWRIAGFTDCSTTCGGGTQETEIVCVKGNSQVVVTPENCEPTSIPRRQTVACNTHPCPPDWEPADWGECSRTCGMGIETRTVECRRRLTPTVTVSVSASQCNNSIRPAVTQMCQEKACAEWKITDWSKCSTDCGLGERSRKVTCVSTEDKVVSDRHCGLRKPQDKEVCDMGSCAQGWYHTKWNSQCSRDCGSGVYTRKVYCSAADGRELPAKKCSSSKKPREHKSCKDNLPCGGIWFNGPWSKCNATCGTAWKTRAVVCMKNLGGNLLTIVTEENCLAEKKLKTEELCSKRPSCKPEWYMTLWSECSVSCGTGSKTREVKCLDSDLVPNFDCKPSKRPRERQSCNRQSCTIKKKTESRKSNSIQKDDSGGSECVDVFPDWCRLVKQARICGYKYYKQQCCVTCRDHTKS